MKGLRQRRGEKRFWERRVRRGGVTKVRREKERWVVNKKGRGEEAEES